MQVVALPSCVSTQVPTFTENWDNTRRMTVGFVKICHGKAAMLTDR